MKKLLPFLQYIFFLAIGIFLLYLAFKGQNIDDLIEGFRNANYFWIGLALIAGLLSHISRAIRWKMMIKPLGHDISMWNSFVAVMIGYIANLAVPRMGEVSRCVVLNRSNNIPVNKLFGTVVVERVIDLFCLLLLFIVAFSVEFGRLTDFFAKNTGFSLADKITPLYITAFIILSLAGIFATRMLFSMSQPPAFIVKFRELIKGFVSGLTSIKNMENKWAFIFHSVFIWSMYFIMIYIGFFALDATAGLNIFAALTVFVVGSLGFVLPSPGGIGTFHLAVRESLLLYGVTREDGIIFATLIHASQTLLVLVFGTFAIIAFLFALKNRNKYESSPENQIEDIYAGEISGNP